MTQAPGRPATSTALGSVAARGAFVTLAGQGARILVQLASIVVLGRLLQPHDYGLLAMVMAVVGVGEVLRDFGLSSAAIQAKTLSRAQRDNLFWANTGIGLLLAAATAGAAGLIAAFYDEPALQGITQALAVTFVLNGLATQYRADLNRRLLFGRLAACDLSAQAVGLAAGVAVALAGGGYWALVAMQLAKAVWGAASVVLLARWLPGRPRRGNDMGGFFSFGWRLVGTQLIGYAGNNIDALVIGQRFGAGPLGLYNRAFQLLMLPLTQVRAPTTTVALPVLARLQDDPVRYSAFLLRGQIALGYTLVAGVAVAAGAAGPLIGLALGDRWLAVAPIFAVLAVAGGFETLAYVGYWVYLSRGLTSDLLRYTLVSAAVRTVCILVGSQWGVIGVAVGYAVGPALLWPLSLWWLSRLAPIPLSGLVMGALRIVLMALAAGGSVAGVVRIEHGLPQVVQLASAAAVAVAVYAVGALLVPAVRRDVAGVVDIGRRVVARRPLDVVAAG